MTIKDILKAKGKAVATIRPEATLHEALRKLVAERIGSLMVTDDRGKVVGIITERDILRECAERCELIQKLPVGQVMVSNLIIGLPEDDLGYAMGIMTQNRVRHLPIMNGDRLEGLISIGDLVKAQLEETEYENRYLKDYIQR